MLFFSFFFSYFFIAVNDRLAKQIPSPPPAARRPEGHPSVGPHFSLRFVVESFFPICGESHSAQYAGWLAPAARPHHKSLRSETELYLHSASIHFWSQGSGIEFCPSPQPPYIPTPLPSSLSFCPVKCSDLRACSCAMTSPQTVIPPSVCYTLRGLH